MVDPNSGDELMHRRFMGLESSRRVPSQAPRDKVNKSFVITFQRLAKIPGARPPTPAFRGNTKPWLTHRIKKQLLAAALLNEMLLRWTKYLHDTRKLLLLVLSGEDRVSGVELGENAPQTPHVDRHPVRGTQDHFGRSIKPRLDVRVYLFIFKTAGTEINDLDLRMHWMSKQYVLRLEIAVDDLVTVKKYEAGQELLRKAPNQLQRETLKVVRFDEFVQIHAQQVGGDTQVTSKVEALVEIDHAVSVVRILL